MPIDTLEIVLGSVVGGFALFVAIWLLVSGILAAAGWSSLVRPYAVEAASAPGQRQGLRIAWVGRARYRGSALRVATGAAGLYLEAHPMFRFRHPPLLVPWSDVRAGAMGERRAKGRRFTGQEILFARGDASLWVEQDVASVLLSSIRR